MPRKHIDIWYVDRFKCGGFQSLQGRSHNRICIQSSLIQKHVIRVRTYRSLTYFQLQCIYFYELLFNSWYIDKKFLNVCWIKSWRIPRINWNIICVCLYIRSSRENTKWNRLVDVVAQNVFDLPMFVLLALMIGMFWTILAKG